MNLNSADSDICMISDSDEDDSLFKIVQIDLSSAIQTPLINDSQYQQNL